MVLMLASIRHRAGVSGIRGIGQGSSGIGLYSGFLMISVRVQVQARYFYNNSSSQIIITGQVRVRVGTPYVSTLSTVQYCTSTILYQHLATTRMTYLGTVCSDLLVQYHLLLLYLRVLLYEYLLPPDDTYASIWITYRVSTSPGKQESQNVQELSLIYWPDLAIALEY